MTFPPHPVRGVNVRFTRPSCQGGTAFVTVDLEPLPAGVFGFAFHDAADWANDAELGVDADGLRECSLAAGEGVLLALAGDPDGSGAVASPQTVRGLRFAFPPREAPQPGTFADALRRGFPLRGESGRPLLAARVTVYQLRYHPIDSAPYVFRKAGIRAAYDALRSVNGIPAGGDPWNWGHPSDEAVEGMPPSAPESGDRATTARADHHLNERRA